MYIGEGCEIRAPKPYNYGKGGTLWKKRLYIRLGKESGRIMRNFDLKNVITTVEGPDTLEKIPSIPIGEQKKLAKSFDTFRNFA